MIRINGKTKLELENVRDEIFRVKTHSDAIERLLIKRVVLEEKIAELESDREQEKKRQTKQDLHLGSERKDALKAMAAEHGIADPAVLVDLLMLHFNTSPSFSREVLLSFAKLR